MAKDVRIELTPAQKAKIKEATGRSTSEIRVSSFSKTPAGPTSVSGLDTSAGALDTSAGALDTSAGALDTNAGAMDTSAGALDTSAGDIDS